ncbi:hypothetical protein T440DRAFT_523477 [Plenodomus tracheiphilus IPT5]|uniref:Uncharacterized protein n=1 Tax=Plenodomus tracheiphilus IPT5 TaxID=1408161 RepID=A0A6A7AMN5_9PLEO|nr:hypothetical protein T440DRAFT_523477 [Plenodomus tracheiphilus IPT5]
MSLLPPRSNDDKYDEQLFQQLNYALVWIDIARQQLSKKNGTIKNLHENLEREGNIWFNRNLSLQQELEALRYQKQVVVQDGVPAHELDPGHVHGDVEDAFDADQHLEFFEASQSVEPIVLKEGKLRRVRKKRGTARGTIG